MRTHQIFKLEENKGENVIIATFPTPWALYPNSRKRFGNNDSLSGRPLGC
jgi:hypothetical protein